MDKVYTVSQINKYVKMLFDKDNFLNNITVSNVSPCSPDCIYIFAA